MARLHPLIVRSLDMSKVGGLDNEALATQLLAFLDTAEAEIGTLSPLERQRVVTELVHDIKGLGPIEPLLQDAEVSDILINGMHSTYVERRGGRLEPVALAFRDAQHLVHIAQRIAGQIGRRVDESSPMVDARLPDGSRVNIIIPPLALDGAAISIRRFVMRGSSLTDMAERGVLSSAMAEMFQIAVKARLNILISGGTGAGKTTFMNALSREIPDGERLITIEDAAELQLQQPHVVRLETRTVSAEGTGQVTMRDLLVNTLRMRPDRIIVGRDTRGRGAGDAPGDEHRAPCCFPLYLVGSLHDLTGLFRRRISWDDGAIRDTTGRGEVAFLMNDCCRSGGDVAARAASVGKGWASAVHLSMPCPTRSVGRRSVRRTRPHLHRLELRPPAP